MLEKEYFTPELIVAGAKEFGSVAPREAAFNALAFTLDTEAVALICKEVGNEVHYVGAPSSHFASKGAAYSRLYHVLGADDGAYILDEVAHSILIIKEEGNYETYSATFDQVRQLCQERSLEPTLIDEQHEAGRWETVTFEEAKRSRAVNEKVTILSGFLAVLLGVAWIGMSVTEGTLKQSAYNYDLSAQGRITKAIKEIPTYQPVDAVLSDLSIAKAVAAKSGGWINRFEVDGDQTGVEIMMPRWVTRDYIAPLGNVKAERDASGQMIRVYRDINKGKR